MNKKICYFTCFWLGDRRKIYPEYEQDRLYYLKQQIKALQTYNHSLNKIIFTFNITPEQYHYFSEIFRITPKYINGVEVEIIFRKNQGISFGAFSDAFSKHKTQYDYYIFTEDDHIFCVDNFDTYLVDKHNSYPDCGFIGMVNREPASWFNYKKHAGVGAGLASSSNLLKLYNFSGGKLPHPYKTLDDFVGNIDKAYKHFEDGQIDFTFNFLKLGLNLYDVRDDYQIIVDAPNNANADVCIYFKDQHESIFYKPLKIINKNYSWFACDDIEFRKNYTLLSPEEALYCYDNKLGYDEYRPYE